jgi:hypothetical protein
VPIAAGELVTITFPPTSRDLIIKTTISARWFGGKVTTSIFNELLLSSDPEKEKHFSVEATCLRLISSRNPAAADAADAAAPAAADAADAAAPAAAAGGDCT